MTAPRATPTFSFPARLLLLCVCLLNSGAHTEVRAQSTAPQQTLALASADTSRGIELYQQGNLPEAIKLLKKASKDHPTDTVAWQFLGLALSQKGDTKGARKALEKAINLRFFGLVRVLDTLIFQSNKYEDLSVPEREAFRQELVRRYQAAFESVDAYLQLKPKDTGFWRAQRDELSFYADNTNKPLAEATVFHAGDVTKRAIILRKPEPEFTEEARAHDTQGTIIVRMILAADGTVQHVLVLRALPDGLTENALKAARMIKFQPAIRDGHSVSSVVTIEYGFHIY